MRGKTKIYDLSGKPFYWDPSTVDELGRAYIEDDVEDRGYLGYYKIILYCTRGPEKVYVLMFFEDFPDSMEEAISGFFKTLTEDEAVAWLRDYTLVPDELRVFRF